MKKKENKNINKRKEDILKKVKRIVSIEGWSSAILIKLQKQNIEKSDLFNFFPDGYKDLLEYALQDINIRLENKLKKINLINFPINKRIKKILCINSIINENLFIFEGDIRDPDILKKIFISNE